MSLLDLQNKLRQTLAQVASNPTLNKAANTFMDPRFNIFATKQFQQLGIQPLTQAAKSAVKLSPGYQAYRGVAGKPVKIKEGLRDVANVARGAGAVTLGPLGYASSAGIGAALNYKNPIQGAYRGIQMGQQYGGLTRLTSPVISRFAPQVAMGRIGQGAMNVAENRLQDVATGRKTTVPEDILSFAMGAAGKPFGAKRVSVKGIDKNAILTNDQAKRVGRIMKEYEQSGKLSRDAVEEAWKILVKDTKKMASKEGRKDFMRADDKTIYAAVKNLMTKNQEYAFKDLAFGIKGEPQVKVKGEIPAGTKERGFIKTVKEAEVTPQPVKETINAYYRPKTNKAEVAAAETTLNLLGWDKAKSRVLTGELDGNTSALGQLMAKKSFDAGKFEEGNEIIKAMSAKATRSGQGIQALSMWSRFTPEGMVKYAQSEIEKAKDTMPLLNRILGTKKTDWTSEDSKAITEMMKKVNLLPDGPEKTQATKDVFEYISKKMPWGVSDVLDEFRYNNMLSNPLTHLRNAVNNLQQALLVRPATLVAEGKPIEAVKYEIGAIKSLPDAISAFKTSMKSGESFGKMDVDVGQLRKPKKLGAYNLPSNAMEAADKFFSAIIMGGEKARGTSAEKALQQAEYSLFRQDLSPGEQGFVLNKIDDVTRATYQLRKVGLGWFIPFIRTPMNVAKQWIEYSPAGVTTIAGAGNKREQLGKALLGSMVTLIGAELALKGKTTWAAPTDPTQKKLFYDSGRKPYSIKIGDKWVPMQTFGVFAWALGIPAASKYYNDDSNTALTDDMLSKLSKTALSGLGFWSNQTFVSGLGSFVKLAEGDADYSLAKNLAYTVGQLKPWSGFMRYVSTIMDPVYRKASGFKEQLMADVPGMTQNLQPYTNTFGEPSTRNLSNYIAPYSMGIANQGFEDMFQQRTVKLQSNALERQVKNEMEKSQGVTQAGGETAVYTIDGSNVEGKVVNGKFIYWDPETSSIKSPTVKSIEKAQRKDEKGLVDAEYSLYSDRLKRADDTAGWRSLTNDYIGYLKEYRDSLNRQEDAKEIISVTNKIEDLEYSLAKGSKPKKVTIKKVTVSAPKKRSALSTRTIKLPPHPTISKPQLKAIKVSGNITKTPQYKIKTYKNTLTQGIIKLV